MQHLIVPDYKSKASDVIVEYEISPSFQGDFYELMQEISDTYLIGHEYINREKLPHIFAIQQGLNRFKMAFPSQSLETQNPAQHLSTFTAFFTHTFPADIKVQAVHWPNEIIAHFAGPQGHQEIRNKIQVFHRPLTAVPLLPRSGAQPKELLEKAYHIWMSGCDIVVESPEIHSPSLSEFEERIEFISKEQQNCRKRTGQYKLYLPNIGAGTIGEMEYRLRKLREKGLEFAIINSDFIGLTALQSLVQACRSLDIGLFIHEGKDLLPSANAHISDTVYHQLLQMIGLENRPMIKTPEHEINSNELLPNVFSSFQLETSLTEVEELIKQHGHDIILQANKPVYLHPDGLKAGAEAFRIAVDAAAQGIHYENAALKNESLKKAFESEGLSVTS